ncbi:hypothetical protein [Xanthobacter sediminis]|uniref:hypothetical protein n=1 Tax=Xanthobacter sediminis TaxID=3119926 RepID=UPI003729A70C
MASLLRPCLKVARQDAAETWALRMRAPGGKVERARVTPQFCSLVMGRLSGASLFRLSPASYIRLANRRFSAPLPV